MQNPLQSPFYRVTIKALVRDHEGKVLVIENAHGEWEMPGGGWEHDEDFATCLNREIQEELGVGASTIGDIQFMYKTVSSKGYYVLRIMVTAEFESHDFTMGEGMRSAMFVSKEEFLATNFAHGEAPIQDWVDKIWPNS
jgi:8-oxo-dGTP pyrophosphatase MutT (NUDIX family)